MKPTDKQLRDVTVRLRRMSELRKRIKALIPTHPEILTMSDKPDELFTVPGFSVEGLELTRSEVNCVLTTAIDEWKRE